MDKIIGGVPVTLMVTMFSAGILKTYIDTLFAKGKRNLLSIGAWSIFLVWQFLITRSNDFPFYVNMIVNTCTIILVAMSYSGKKLKKVSFSIVYFTVWAVVEFIIGYILILSGMDFMLPGPQLFLSVTSKMGLLVLIICLKQLLKKEDVKEIADDNKSIILIFVLVSALWFTLFFVFLTQPFGVFTLFISIVIMTLSVIIFLIYRKFVEEMEIKYRSELYFEQLSLYKKSTQENEAVMKSIRKMAHDIKHHFVSLLDFLEKKELDSASEYLKKVIWDYDSTKIGVVDTGNIAVDAIINHKCAVAKDQHIDFQIHLMIPDILPFENPDLSVIIGNALDNAIEATLKVPEAKRFVKIEMEFSVKEDFKKLKMEFENSFDGNTRESYKGGFLTTKPDKENHGIGITTITHIAEKYDGYCRASYHGDVFHLKVALFVSK